MPGLEWQMPQGGIDGAEDPHAAVFRELWEETGVVSASYLGETGGLPMNFRLMTVRAHRLAIFRGQRQKWFALRFTGDDEIDLLSARNGQPAEFDRWRWERLDRVADLVVPFRRDVYGASRAEFARIRAMRLLVAVSRSPVANASR